MQSETFEPHCGWLPISDGGGKRKLSPYIGNLLTLWALKRRKSGLRGKGDSQINTLLSFGTLRVRETKKPPNGSREKCYPGSKWKILSHVKFLLIAKVNVMGCRQGHSYI